MRNFEGRIREMRLAPGGAEAAWVECPPAALPAAGQWTLGDKRTLEYQRTLGEQRTLEYQRMLTSQPSEWEAPLGTPLFPSEISSRGFLAVPPIPATWGPGTTLHLRGPLGRGFQVLSTHRGSRKSHRGRFPRRLALAALGETVLRLLPLLPEALAQGGDVAVFADCPLPPLPPSVEAYPLSSLSEALDWAEFLALDLPIDALGQLRQTLGLAPGARLDCRGEALIVAPMPCGGAGGCGACAVPAPRRAWKLACSEGPVFDLKEIDW